MRNRLRRYIPLLLLASTRAVAQPPDSVTVDTVAPGVIHTRLVRLSDPWRAHVVTVNLRSGCCEIVATRARDSLRGREKTSAMVARAAASGLRVLAAINADFFDLGTGENENNQVISGRWLKGVAVTDSPHDTFRNAHIQLAVGVDGRPYIDRFAFSGTVTRGRRRVALDGMNGIPRIAEALVLFTDARGAATRRDSSATAYEIVLREHASSANGVRRWEVVRGIQPVDSSLVMPGSGRLVAYGAARTRLDSIVAVKGHVETTVGTIPDRGRLTMVVGGWPRIVQNGRNIAARADCIEGTFPRFSVNRHPRSAAGISRDSTTLYLVTVDGRQEASAGMSLVELADLLLSLGVHDGMNFDGGGSTTLVIRDRIVNRPSDPQGERSVGNAVLVLQR